MAAVGQEFWVVAAGCGSGNADKDSYLQSLKSSAALAPAKSADGGPWKFDVPDGDRSLPIGSFDTLIRLTDDLQKYDGQVDSIIHRLERQLIELDPRADFKVKMHRKEVSLTEYLKNWQWDEARFSKTRSIADNITSLMNSVTKLDEEARNKTAMYNDLKTQSSNLKVKEGANLTNRDLIDLLTPDVVKSQGGTGDDFIYTEHLTTICVILARGADKDFLQVYETMSEMVVPQSAKHFKGLDDKDGNQLWRVVLFKSHAEAFKKQCRERRFVARDFEYSEDGYKKLVASRSQVEDSVKRQLDLVKAIYKAAWSEALVAWMHVKAMRVFVESVLRFGMPPRFAAFIVSPKANATVAARKALADVLGKGSKGGPFEAQGKGAEAQDDGEEYFPYVSMSFVPFTTPRA